jgi:hypothetical protein
VREYNALDRNDLAYIPKTVTKNGVTLQLEDVEWVVMGTTPSGDSLVPNLFKAIAAYSGTATGARVSGYTATITYSGTVERTIPGETLYSVVYRGEPTPAPAADSQAEKPARTFWPAFLIVTWFLVLLTGAGAAAFVFVRRRRKATEAEEYENDDFVENGEW